MLNQTMKTTCVKCTNMYLYNFQSCAPCLPVYSLRDLSFLYLLKHDPAKTSFIPS